VLPAAVTRSAPFLLVVFADEVGFKSPELSVAVVCAGLVTAACVLCQLGELIGAKGRKKIQTYTIVFDGEVVVDDVELGWVMEN
jgi:hypothetical protein